MLSVQRWSAREVKALRQALRLSQRKFADHLGVNPRLIAKWEAGQTRPGPSNQSMLDTALTLADQAQQAMFADLLAPDGRRPVSRGPLCQLLRDITDFTGRDEEIRELIGLLTSPPANGVRVIAIHGPAGVGKTVLATHVAHHVRVAYPDGQLYVNLRGNQTERVPVGDVITSLLNDLDWDAPIPDNGEDRARALRTVLSQRRILLVLDNAQDEEQVIPLLPGDSSCAVLVTSRRRLTGIDGAEHLSLRLMTPDQGLSLLTAIVGAGRIDAEPPAAAEIVQLCGRLPLALRIFGARVAARRASTLTAAAGLLRDERARLDALRDGERAVRASFRISYDGCTEPVRRAFRLLGIVQDIDFPAWVLASLAELTVAEAESRLEALVDAELLDIASEGYYARHYRLHDLLHLFAREQLEAEEESGDRGEAARRLLNEYIAMTARALCRDDPYAANELEAPPAELRAIHDAIEKDPHRWSRSEWPALVSAVAIAHDNDLWPEAWLLAEQLGTLSRLHSGWSDWERIVERGLETARAGGDHAREARLRWSVGVLRREQGRFRDSILQLRYSADLFDLQGDEFHKAVVHRALADTFRFTGQLAEGIEHFALALGTFERTGHDQLAAGSLSGMGDSYRGLSRWDESILCLDRAIALYSESSNRRGLARAKVRLGIVWRDRCHYRQAEQLFNESLHIMCLLGDRRWKAQTLRQLGIVCRNTGRIPPALDFLSHALTISESLADSRNVAVTLRNLGDANRYAGEFTHAERQLGDALTRFQRLPDRRWEARTLASLGDLDRACGNHERADANLDAALSIFSDIGDRPGQARVLRGRGILRREQRLFEDSLAAFAASGAIFGDLGDQVWVARALAGSATTHSAAGLSGAPELLVEAYTECHRAGAESDQEIIDWLFEW